MPKRKQAPNLQQLKTLFQLLIKVYRKSQQNFKGNESLYYGAIAALYPVAAEYAKLAKLPFKIINASQSSSSRLFQSTTMPDEIFENYYQLVKEHVSLKKTIQSQENELNSLLRIYNASQRNNNKLHMQLYKDHTPEEVNRVAELLKEQEYLQKLIADRMEAKTKMQSQLIPRSCAFQKAQQQAQDSSSVEAQAQQLEHGICDRLELVSNQLVCSSITPQVRRLRQQYKLSGKNKQNLFAKGKQIDKLRVKNGSIIDRLDVKNHPNFLAWVKGFDIQVTKLYEHIAKQNSAEELVGAQVKKQRKAPS